jgi:hypothetical protein
VAEYAGSDLLEAIAWEMKAHHKENNGMILPFPVEGTGTPATRPLRLRVRQPSERLCSQKRSWSIGEHCMLTGLGCTLPVSLEVKMEIPVK